NWPALPSLGRMNQVHGVLPHRVKETALSGYRRLSLRECDIAHISAGKLRPACCRWRGRSWPASAITVVKKTVRDRVSQADVLGPQLDWNDDLFRARQPWKVVPDGVGDIVWRKMRIVLLSHAGIGVSELAGNDRHWHRPHREQRAVGVTQNVKSDGRHDP